MAERVVREVVSAWPSAARAHAHVASTRSTVLRRALVVTFALLAQLPSVAHATFSVVLANPSSGELGGVVASCVGDYDLESSIGIVPNVGAFAAQGLVPSPGRAALPDLLDSGESAANVLNTITDATFDPEARQRQYGVVLLSGDSAAFTGAETLAVATHLHGHAGPFVYSVQGNILTDPDMLQRMVDALTSSDASAESDHCDLPAALAAAMAAATRDGSGDSRCTEAGIDSDSAHLHAQARLTAPLKLGVVNSAPRSASEELLAQFATWRESSPCVQASDGAMPVGSASADDSTSRDDGGVPVVNAPRASAGSCAISRRAGGEGWLALVCVATLVGGVRRCRRRLV